MTVVFCSMKTTLNRFAKGNSRRDLFSHFVQEDGQLHPDMEMKDLDADVRVMIIAGESTIIDTYPTLRNRQLTFWKQDQIRLPQFWRLFWNISLSILSG